MNKKEIIRTVESLHPDLTYTKDQILEIVEQIEDENPIENTIGKILTMFMVDDNTLFDINDVNRILKYVLDKINQERS